MTVPCRGDGTLQESFSLNDVLIYPNPSFGNFTIDFTGAPIGDVRVECTDMQGRYITVAVDEISTDRYSISGLAAGVYLVTFISQDQTTTKRIIKL